MIFGKVLTDMFDSDENKNVENNENKVDKNTVGNAGQNQNDNPIATEKSGTVWNGEYYHGTSASGFGSSQASEHSEGEQPYSRYNTYGTQSNENPDQNPDRTAETGQKNYYRNYNACIPPFPNDAQPGKPKQKKEKKHIFRKVLIGVLACLVVSAGSIATVVALINNGTIKVQSSSGTNPAFTIIQNASSSSGSTKATSTSVTTSDLTKQEVAKKVLPSVVCIENYSSTSIRGSVRGNGGGNTANDTATDTTDTVNNGEVSPTSEGSGIITTTDGYIITNAHVVSGAYKLKVVLYDGKTYSATLIGSDSITDLALIKINATGLTAAEFGSSTDLQVADTVMAIGNPGGMEFNSSVTVGYISALNREITNSETGYTMKCIQTDAAINPGNSGGALVNMKGQVVGINSSKIVATGYEGLGFAIPVDTVQPIISQIKQYGYVKDRAMLGVGGGFIDSTTAYFYHLTSGFYISSVSSEYVTSAGIQEGDIITKIDDKSVTSNNTISSVVASKKPGDTVTLTVVRPSTGKTFTASVKLSQATGKS